MTSIRYDFGLKSSAIADLERFWPNPAHHNRHRAPKWPFCVTLVTFWVICGLWGFNLTTVASSVCRMSETPTQIESTTPLVDDAMLSGRQAAKRLGVCRQTFRRLVRDRQIGFLQVGTRKKFPASEVAAFIARNFVSRLENKQPRQVPFDGELAASAGATATPEIIPNWQRLQDQKKAEQNDTNATGDTKRDGSPAKEGQPQKEAKGDNQTGSQLSGPTGKAEPGEQTGFAESLPEFSIDDFTG